jgi:hypothetical protein
MAQVIKATGKITEVIPAHGPTFTLDELQKIVGGYIELVVTTEGDFMFVNEDGLRLGLPFNSLASSHYGGISPHGIVGDVVICKRHEVD